MKVTEVLALVAGKLIELVRTVVMAGWGPVLRLLIVLSVITVLVMVARAGYIGPQ